MALLLLFYILFETWQVFISTLLLVIEININTNSLYLKQNNLYDSNYSFSFISLTKSRENQFIYFITKFFSLLSQYYRKKLTEKEKRNIKVTISQFTQKLRLETLYHSTFIFSEDLAIYSSQHFKKHNFFTRFISEVFLSFTLNKQTNQINK